MYPSIRRRFGIREPFPLALVALLVLISDNRLVRSTEPRYQHPSDPAGVQVRVRLRRRMSDPTPQIDPEALIRIPVTVIDDAGRCVRSLSARDFSLSVDGEESPIPLFRPNRATAAALGVLVDISQSMAFKSFSASGLSRSCPLCSRDQRRSIDKLHCARQCIPRHLRAPLSHDR